MKEHLAEIIGSIVAALMVVVVVVLSNSFDNAAPVIKFEGDVEYCEGDDINNLLQGVSAYDEHDGDVTDNLMIDSLIVMEGNEFAKVTYLAKDSRNNIAKKSRIVIYSGSGKNIYASYANSGDGTVAYVENDFGTNVKETESESIAPTEPPTQPSTENPAQTTAENESVSDTAGATEQTSTGVTPQTTSGADAQTTALEGAPVLELSQSSCTVKLGNRFNVSTYVKSIVDDKDSRETLYRRIGIEGSYDVNTPGEYTFKVYCIDSERNLSNKETFTLRVEE